MVAAEHIQPFHHHVQELRRRITIVAAVLIMGGTVGYGFHARLITWLSAPLKQKLYYTSPSGGLQFALEVCLFAGVLLALPVAIYQLIRFIEPAIQHHLKGSSIKRWQVLRFITFSYCLALLGATFAYLVCCRLHSTFLPASILLKCSLS